MSLTPEDIEAEWWAVWYSDPRNKDSYEDEAFDLDALVNASESDWETLLNETFST